MDRPREVERLTQTFLEAMGLSLTPTVSEQEDSIQIDLSGPDSYLLLERKGSVLEAMQLLLGKVAESELGAGKRVVVDCDGYRREREQALIDEALQVAEKVRRLGAPIELEPLNPYERRLVHLAISEEPGVASESQGDGFLKRIVISPA